ncbi:MAG TPA: hypothetical protein VFQ53_08425 [Kofleriaceae bacterium]|nr:hypothetical protein [Kofleriaceae bacterium]
MAYAFLSDLWFAEVDKLVAAAGDLKIPDAMKAARVNINVTSPAGTRPIHLVDGLFHPGHQATADATLTLTEALARKIFLEADAAAGVQAFLAGEMQVEGDLAKIVAMQTVEPSVPQQQLTKRIAAITE